MERLLVIANIHPPSFSRTVQTYQLVTLFNLEGNPLIRLIEGSKRE
mgnify:FL=1